MGEFLIVAVACTLFALVLLGVAWWTWKMNSGEKLRVWTVPVAVIVVIWSLLAFAFGLAHLVS